MKTATQLMLFIALILSPLLLLLSSPLYARELSLSTLTQPPHLQSDFAKHLSERLKHPVFYEKY